MLILLNLYSYSNIKGDRVKIMCKNKILTGVLSLFNIAVLLAQADVNITGTASYYHQKFNGRKTANGEIFHNDSLTAAHKTLPFGTLVKVTDLKNKSWIIVRINDRLPATSKRAIDLSQAAAKELKMIESGLAKVSIELLQKDSLREISRE